MTRISIHIYSDTFGDMSADLDTYGSMGDKEKSILDALDILKIRIARYYNIQTEDTNEDHQANR